MCVAGGTLGLMPTAQLSLSGGWGDLAHPTLPPGRLCCPHTCSLRTTSHRGC